MFSFPGKSLSLTLSCLQKVTIVSLKGIAHFSYPVGNCFEQVSCNVSLEWILRERELVKIYQSAGHAPSIYQCLWLEHQNGDNSSYDHSLKSCGSNWAKTWGPGEKGADWGEYMYNTGFWDSCCVSLCFILFLSLVDFGCDVIKYAIWSVPSDLWQSIGEWV